MVLHADTSGTAGTTGTSGTEMYCTCIKMYFLLFTTDRCTLQPDSGLCRAYIPSYFYNVTSGDCERFIYGGCGGNENRFPTAADCAANCSGNGK